MPDLDSKLVVLCGSRFALPAIYNLHQHKKIAVVVCYTRNPEFEEELINFCNQLNLKLKILEKQSWQKQLEEILIEIKPLAVLVKTFAFKIPSRFFQLAKRGFINFHYALLPQYRGAFPLYEVIRKQEPYGGVTLHYLAESFDKGPIIMQQYVPIKPDETYGKHEMNLASEGARLSLLLTEMLEDESILIPSLEQDETNAKIIARPALANLIIKWNEMTAEEIVAMILATNPWGKGAIANWMNVSVQLLYARYYPTSLAGALPGEIIEISEEKGLRVACIENKSIWVDIIYTQDGYLPGFKLKDFGIKKGQVAFNPSVG